MNRRSEHLKVLIGNEEKDRQALQEHEARLRQYNDERQKAEDEISRLTARLEEAKVSLTTVEGSITNGKNAISLLTTRITEAKPEIDRLNAEVQRLGQAIWHSREFQINPGGQRNGN
ncbi:hypothetical protein HK405_003718, partial [Cladochytrium tenue]